MKEIYDNYKHLKSFVVCLAHYQLSLVEYFQCSIQLYFVFDSSCMPFWNIEQNIYIEFKLEDSVTQKPLNTI